MNKTKTFMVAIPALLAIMMLTTTTQAHAFWGGGSYCEAPWYHGPPCVSDNQQPSTTYHNVDYGSIWTTPSGF